MHTFATSGDQIQPGDTEFTLILYFAKSKAMFFVRMLIAPLDAAYVHLKEYDENKNFDSCTKFQSRFCSTPTFIINFQYGRLHQSEDKLYTRSGKVGGGELYLARFLCEAGRGVYKRVAFLSAR